MQTITVPLGERSYPIHIERGLLAKTGAMIREKLGDIAVAVISDDHVAPLYMEEVVSSMEKVGLRVCSIVLPHGEQTKCLKSLETLYAFLCEHHLTRKDAIVALGGGVIGDLAGLAAATYLRGVHLCSCRRRCWRRLIPLSAGRSRSICRRGRTSLAHSISRNWSWWTRIRCGR